MHSAKYACWWKLIDEQMYNVAFDSSRWFSGGATDGDSSMANHWQCGIRSTFRTVLHFSFTNFPQYYSAVNCSELRETPYPYSMQICMWFIFS